MVATGAALAEATAVEATEEEASSREEEGTRATEEDQEEGSEDHPGMSPVTLTPPAALPSPNTASTAQRAKWRWRVRAHVVGPRHKARREAEPRTRAADKSHILIGLRRGRGCSIAGKPHASSRPPFSFPPLCRAVVTLAIPLPSSSSPSPSPPPPHSWSPPPSYSPSHPVPHLPLFLPLLLPLFQGRRYWLPARWLRRLFSTRWASSSDGRGRTPSRHGRRGRLQARL